MNDKKSVFSTSTGLGVGYVSLIMLFAVICLTVLAVLSFQAAGSNEMLNERSSSFNSQYYRADGRAKSILMRLDNAALSAHENGFFEDSFAEGCGQLSAVELTRTAEGFKAAYTEVINERLSLSVEVLFYSAPVDGSRYRIDRWQTVPADSEEQESSLGVWDGGILQ